MMDDFEWAYSIFRKRESCEMGKSVAQMFLEKLNFICKHTLYKKEILVF